MKPGQTIEEIAMSRVKRKRGFYRHLGIWGTISVCFLLFLAMVGTDIEDLFGMAGVFGLWGAAVGIHYVTIFGLPVLGFGGPEWEERQFNREMDKLEGIIEDDDRLELRELRRERSEERISRRDDFV